MALFSDEAWVESWGTKEEAEAYAIVHAQRMKEMEPEFRAQRERRALAEEAIQADVIFLKKEIEKAIATKSLVRVSVSDLRCYFYHDLNSFFDIISKEHRSFRGWVVNIVNKRLSVGKNAYIMVTELRSDKERRSALKEE